MEIIPGSAQHGGLPDGGTFTLNTNPRRNHNVPFVDLDTAFATFGPKTQQGLRSALADFGDAVAGRGTEFNDSIYSLRRLIGPLESLLALLAVARHPPLAAHQRSGGDDRGAGSGRADRDLAAQRRRVTTFAALQRSQLGAAIDQTPPTEALATTVLTNARPVLRQAATIVQALKPGAALLPLAAQRLDAILTGATPVFRRVPQLAGALNTALTAVDALARDPASTARSRSSAPTTWPPSAPRPSSASARSCGPSPPSSSPATSPPCGCATSPSSLSEGDSTAAWLRFAPIIDLNQEFQSGDPRLGSAHQPLPQGERQLVPGR